MKFNKNIIAAAVAVMGMAACQPEVKQPTDAEINPLVDAKVAEMKLKLQEECDNSIMGMATAKADSILVAMANKPARTVSVPTPAPAPRNTNTKNPRVVKDPPPTKPNTTKSGGLRSQSDDNKSNDKTSVQGGGLRSKSDAQKAGDSKAVEGGGLRSRSDRATQ